MKPRLPKDWIGLLKERTHGPKDGGGAVSLDRGVSKTCERETLKRLLLCLGTEPIACIHNATVVRYRLKHKHLGVGVYEIWLQKDDERNVQ